jgi:flagellar biosynthetic protein FlhB
VPRSRELAAAFVVLAGAAVLWGGQPYFGAGLQGLFELGLSVPRDAALDEATLGRSLSAALALALELLAPLFFAVIGAAVVASLAFGGFAMSFEALTPKLEKLNPLAGFKRIFGWNGLAELLKALAKVLVVAAAPRGSRCCRSSVSPRAYCSLQPPTCRISTGNTGATSR